MGKEIQISSLEDMCSLMCDNTIPTHSIKRCIRCGRPLKTQEAIEKGYGKTCEKYILKSNDSNFRLFD